MLRAVLQTAFINGCLAIVTLATSVLSARLLGAEGRGHLANAQVLPSMVGSFAMIGLGEAVVYRMARGSTRPSEVVGSGLLIALSTATIALVAARLGELLVTTYAGSVDPAASTYWLIVPLMALVQVPNSAFRAAHTFRLWNVLRLFPAVLWLGSLCLMWLNGLDRVLDAVRLQVGLMCVFALFQVTVLRRTLRITLCFDHSEARRLVSFGGRTVLAQIPQLISQRVDQLAAVQLLALSQAGQYFVALGWSSIPGLLLQAVASIAFPKLASAADPQGRAAGVAILSRLSALTATFLFLVVGAVSPVIVPEIYGPDFSEAGILSIFLLAASCMRGWSQVLQEAARGLGRIDWIRCSEMVALLVSVLLVYPLATVFQAVGVAVLLIFSALTSLLAMIYQLRRSLDLRTIDLIFPTKGDIRMVISSARALLDR